MNLKGFSFEIEGVGLTSFRKIGAAAIHNTYSVPPPTTILGLLSNALGLGRDNLSLQDKNLKASAMPLRNKEKTQSLVKMFQIKEKALKPSIFIKEYLVEPRYKIFLVGDEDIIKKSHDVLSDPKRPLYLGDSDTMAIIFNKSPILDVDENAKSKVINSWVRGIICESCEICKLPTKFEKKRSWSVYTELYSIPIKERVDSDGYITCYKIGDEYVHC